MTSHKSVFVFTRDPELETSLTGTLSLWRMEPEVFGDASSLMLAAAERAPAGLVVDAAAIEEVDALELVRAMREHPDTRDVVTVAVLDDLRADGVELARALGCDRLTARPVDPDWIGAEIDRLWSRSRAA